MRYIAVQSDNPIPHGCADVLLIVIQSAQDWANYSKHKVHILDTYTNEVKQIILPD